ncbi:AAA family ATPase [Actinoplanes sp. NPDC048791]|uniref:AAA family ATPase n=1 Tax=Actinoplanes sp. NPDC048791 TaxID=3154623 RepID=UPI0033DF0F2E
MIGRDREILAVGDLVRAGRTGGAWVLRGEAGVGKSALISAVCRELTGTQILMTRGVEAEASLPFAGLHQMLRPIMPLAGTLAPRQQAALAAAMGTGEAQAGEPFILALAVLELLATAADRSPIAIFVDDAQWLDAPSGQVLDFVARRLGAEPVSVSLIIRDGYVSPLTTTGLPELHIDPLDDESARALLDLNAPDLAMPARRHILRVAAGNPLALLELSRAGAGPADGLPGSLPLTSRLQATFSARLHELPPGAQALTLLAATNDQDSARELLLAAPLLKPDAGDTLTTLQFAVDAGLLTVDRGEILFRHPLVRSAVYQGASPADRRVAHSVLAEVVREQPDRRAWHLAAAAVEPDEQTAAAIEAAATRAATRGGRHTSLAALERAAELTPDPLKHALRCLTAAEVAVSSGDSARAVRLLSTASIPRSASPRVTSSVPRLVPRWVPRSKVKHYCSSAVQNARSRTRLTSGGGRYGSKIQLRTRCQSDAKAQH